MSVVYSVIIPAFREEGSLASVLNDIKKVMRERDVIGEIIVIDDGSDDKTGDIARESGVRVLVHPYNKGYGASLKAGIRAARGKTVIFIDADGQHDPTDIWRLLDAKKDYNMIVGARKGTAGSPAWRKPGKKVLSWVVNKLSGHKIPDFNSGLRAIERELALHICPIMPNNFSFSTTSTIACFRGGFNVGYIPINIRTRQAGESSVTWKDGFRTLMLIVRLVTIFSPLRVA